MGFHADADVADDKGNAPPNPRAGQRYLFGTDVWRMAQDDQLQRGSKGWGHRLALWTGLRDRITGGDAWVAGAGRLPGGPRGERVDANRVCGFRSKVH